MKLYGDSLVPGVFRSAPSPTPKIIPSFMCTGISVCVLYWKIGAGGDKGAYHNVQNILDKVFFKIQNVYYELLCSYVRPYS